jgi:hypothetical protein
MIRGQICFPPLCVWFLVDEPASPMPATAFLLQYLIRAIRVIRGSYFLYAGTSGVCRICASSDARLRLRPRVFVFLLMSTRSV